MLEKVRERGHQDPLFFHKTLFVFGSLAGFVAGVFISNSADKFDSAQLEVDNGETESPPGEPTLEQPDSTE